MRSVWRRVLLLVPTTLGALILVFILMRILPGDPAAAMLGTNATPQNVADLRAQLGLNKPMYAQFVDYFSGLLHLDLGYSLAVRTPVVKLLAIALPPTLLLTLGGTLVSIVIGIPLGVIAALRRGRWQDYTASTFALLGISVPPFVWGLVLILLFSLQWKIFPSGGMGNTPLEALRALVLPSLATGFFLVGVVARITRSSLLAVLSQDYVRTARAKGLRYAVVLTRHTLTNALIPVLTIIGLNIGILLGGVVVIETVFTRQGLGRLALDAIFARDYPVIQGVIIVAVLIVVVLNLVTDVLYSVVDPRVRV